MEKIFEHYEVGGAWDEMIQPNGTPRLSALELHHILSSLSPDEFNERCAERDRAFLDRGITFSLSGEERPFPLDPIPRIFAPEEWELIEEGVKQRVRALELFLNDVYTKAEIINDGVIPHKLVAKSPLFAREAHGITTPNQVRIPVAGIDLIRDEHGTFRVLEDNVRTPSGVSYVIENRRAMTQIFPELLSSHRIEPVANYPRHLLEALRSAAPVRAGSTPTIVVLTPGVYNSAYFEHSFLARQMGVELVEGRDLICRQNVVYMRTTSGERRVDVVYRRIDDEYLDPVFFRHDSVLGCAGIINAARTGNVTIASAVGNGVADDKLTYTYVPDIIRYYLGQEPLLPNVPTYRPEEPDQLAMIIERIDRLVIKPVDASGGYGLVIGPVATAETLDATIAALRSSPRSFIAQEVVQLSTAPTKIGNRIEPRHIDLRPFAVNSGDKISVLPGGLTRVALPKGSLIVNSSQGGGSKDTWVIAKGSPIRLASMPRNQVVTAERTTPTTFPLPELPEEAHREGLTGQIQGAQQQQQQQQDEADHIMAHPGFYGKTFRGEFDVE